MIESVSNNDEQDQKDAKKVYSLLKDLSDKHKDIKFYIWLSALCNAYAYWSASSGMSFDEFVSNNEKMINHYKHFFKS